MEKNPFMIQVKKEKQPSFISAKSFLENKIVKVAVRSVFFIFYFCYKNYKGNFNGK